MKSLFFQPIDADLSRMGRPGQVYVTLCHFAMWAFLIMGTIVSLMAWNTFFEAGPYASNNGELVVGAVMVTMIAAAIPLAFAVLGRIVSMLLDIRDAQELDARR